MQNFLHLLTNVAIFPLPLLSTLARNSTVACQFLVNLLSLSWEVEVSSDISRSKWIDLCCREPWMNIAVSQTGSLSLFTINHNLDFCNQTTCLRKAVTEKLRSSLYRCRLNLGFLLVSTLAVSANPFTRQTLKSRGPQPLGHYLAMACSKLGRVCAKLHSRDWKALEQRALVLTCEVPLLLMQVLHWKEHSLLTCHSHQWSCKCAHTPATHMPSPTHRAVMPKWKGWRHLL